MSAVPVKGVWSARATHQREGDAQAHWYVAAHQRLPVLGEAWNTP